MLVEVPAGEKQKLVLSSEGIKLFLQFRDAGSNPFLYFPDRLLPTMSDDTSSREN